MRVAFATTTPEVLAGADLDRPFRGRRFDTGNKQDFLRTRNREGLPIEVLDSLRLLTRSRFAYLDAIIDYNRAQFELYVALGQPPADCLARPIPAHLVPPPAPAAPGPVCAPPR